MKVDQNQEPITLSNMTEMLYERNQKVIIWNSNLRHYSFLKSLILSLKIIHPSVQPAKYIVVIGGVSFLLPLITSPGCLNTAMKLIISALMFTIEQLMIKFSRKLWFHEPVSEQLHCVHGGIYWDRGEINCKDFSTGNEARKHGLKWNTFLVADIMVAIRRVKRLIQFSILAAVVATLFLILQWREISDSEKFDLKRRGK